MDIKKPIMNIRLRASHPDIVQKPVHVSIYLLRDSFQKKTLMDEIVLKNSDWIGRSYFLPNDNFIVISGKNTRSKDSFNPYGASDMTSAIIFGTFNNIISKLKIRRR